MDVKAVDVITDERLLNVHRSLGCGGMSGQDEREGDARSEAFEQLLDTMERLLAEDGCAWHRQQTHESLVKYLVEESYELVDAIERGTAAEIESELGDVLYQVLFHSAIASRDREGFDLLSVLIRLREKLIARHPHVFGDRGYMSVEQLNAEWERLKEDAAGTQRFSRAPLEGIPVSLPTLARAAKTIERLKRAGLFDPRIESAAAETVAKRETRSPGEGAEEIIGRELLDLVVRANALGVDPDQALRRSTGALVSRLGQTLD